jgi:hypothetical protein
MDCEQVRGLLPGYLDGAMPTGKLAGTHLSVGHHLETCDVCRRELNAYQSMSTLMARMQRPMPPADLALKIRVAAAQRLSDRAWVHYMNRLNTRIELILKNILEPLAIPATGGFTVAFVVFVIVCQLLGIGAPLRAGSNDSPTNLLQPARLEFLAPFPITGLEESGHAGPHALLVEATISSQGDAVSYRILAGPDTEIVRRQLDLVLLFSHFRPEMSFGRFTSGGRVVLSFSDISIRG